jgi:Mg/Co/Ni transporter MgtE
MPNKKHAKKVSFEKQPLKWLAKEFFIIAVFVGIVGAAMLFAYVSIWMVSFGHLKIINVGFYGVALVGLALLLLFVAVIFRGSHTVLYAGTIVRYKRERRRFKKQLRQPS